MTGSCCPGRAGVASADLIHVLRGAVIAAFLVTATWAAPMPRSMALVGVGLVFLLLPLSGYRIARRFAAVTWLGFAGAYLVVPSVGFLRSQATSLLVTAILLSASLLWLLYEVAAAHHLTDRDDADRLEDWVRSAIACALLTCATLIVLALVLRSRLGAHVAAPLPAYGPWLLALAIAGVSGVGLFTAIASCGTGRAIVLKNMPVCDDSTR